MMQPYIKFCGIRRLEDVTYMNEFLPDYVGFVFAKSKRQVSPITALALGQELNPQIKRVGVFVNEPIESLLQTATIAKLDVIQLHGDENGSYITVLKQAIVQQKITCEIWKAVRVKDETSIPTANLLDVDKLLLDSFTEFAYGGSGKVANWGLIQKTKITKPFFLAGGLNATNIKDGIKAIDPYGVDLSGSIEVDGYKNRDKIAEIIQQLRGATASSL